MTDFDREMWRRAQHLAALELNHRRSEVFAEAVDAKYPGGRLQGIRVRLPRNGSDGLFRAEIVVKHDGQNKRSFGKGVTAFSAKMAALDAEIGPAGLTGVGGSDDGD